MYKRQQKDLIGIPWLLAFALRSDGWYLRSAIIWQKDNPMPPVPKEYAEPFKVNGLLLPGYGIEGEPPQHTAPQQAAQPTHLDPEKVEMDAIGTRQAATLTTEPPQPQPVIPINLTAEKPAEKLKEITDHLEQGITELFDSERYKEYLRVMSKFYNYSFNNTLLIAMQKPDASLVAGFNSWKNQFQRNVKKLSLIHI